MVEITQWPGALLHPDECRANLVSFSRSGGKTLGGLENVVRTDLGFWKITLNNVAIYNRDQARTWDAIAEALAGRSGLVVVPAWAFDTAPWVDGMPVGPSFTTHSDGTTFDDGTRYSQDNIVVKSVGTAAIGATQMKMRIIRAEADLAGVRFSYNNALYKTGKVLDITGDVWTMKISPTIRATIPDGADLQFDLPTCLCNLTNDSGMDRGINADLFQQVSIDFNEATDYWNLLALGLV